MKTYIFSTVMVVLTYLASCGYEETLGSFDPESTFCDSSGVLKTNMHAMVDRDFTGGDDWILRIEDSVRIAEYFRLWKPHICGGLPDSLKELDLELIVSYVDKSRWHNDTALYMAAELVDIKAVNDVPEQDPRNQNNMETIFVKKADGTNLSIDSGIVITSQESWSEFLTTHPGAVLSREVNFDLRTLVAQPVSHGGCGWIYRRSFERIGQQLYRYKVRAETYRGCQAMQRTYHWVTVPSISEQDSVIFEFEEINHSID